MFAFPVPGIIGIRQIIFSFVVILQFFFDTKKNEMETL